MGKNLPAKKETWVQSLNWEDALEKGMATLSSSQFLPREFHRQRTLVGSWICRVRHNWVANTFTFTCSLYTHFGKNFYHEWMFNLIKCFFCIYWDDHVVFLFSFFNVVYHIDQYAMLNCICDPEMNSFQSWYMMIFCVIGFSSLIFC